MPLASRWVVLSTLLLSACAASNPPRSTMPGPCRLTDVSGCPQPSPRPRRTPSPDIKVIVVVPEPSPTPAEITRTYVFDLKSIQFDFNESALRPASEPMLRDLGDFLAKNPDAWDRLTIEGHTDHIGGAEYNQELSQQRAETVARNIVAQGVQESKIRAIGYGFSRPLVEERTPEDQQKNRRVEFKFRKIQDPELVDRYFRDLNREY